MGLFLILSGKSCRDSLPVGGGCIVFSEEKKFEANSLSSRGTLNKASGSFVIIGGKSLNRNSLPSRARLLQGDGVAFSILKGKTFALEARLITESGLFM